MRLIVHVCKSNSEYFILMADFKNKNGYQQEKIYKLSCELICKEGRHAHQVESWKTEKCVYADILL